MEKEFVKKMVYRIWIFSNGEESEMFFTSKNDAERVKAVYESFGYEVILNGWRWEMHIEK